MKARRGEQPHYSLAFRGRRACPRPNNIDPGTRGVHHSVVRRCDARQERRLRGLSFPQAGYCARVDEA